ncbi:clostripain-related cysteine peptidase [Butyrivibrio proteoclasticus]|uniref:clostripain-related cysteine peptidase n=1 Tax=Butyrivibrio proteoclasticus TaxID=43305 RepID=UPI000478B084|nr:clostripain-related cysteine peptidase [Butyrivibrio proteoclasticus]
MKNNQKKSGKLGKIIIGVLAVLGILFLILMLIPDDEADESFTEGINEENTVTDQHEKPAQQAFGSEDTVSDIDLVSVGTGARSATVMVYMNGSDLETNAGEATADIEEMISSGIGEKVNVIIQTMGTKEWQNYGISSKSAQTYKIEEGGLSLVRDNLGQLDCTAEDTLSEFIGFCKNNYSADRYIIVFWDHGGGPVYGFGYDEWQDDEEAGLTISEMASAFSKNSDIHFDIIGMDCCIMASMETCYAFAPYCKYALLSEDFESGLGWSYKGWMNALEKDPGISTPLLGKYIVDDVITDNENNFGGDSACIGLFNVSTAKDLFNAWKAYAYKNEKVLLNTNYSRMHKAKGRSRNFWDFWGFDVSDVTLSDYYISDILALMESIDNSSKEAQDLTSALKAAVAYYGHTSDKNELTGLAVSLPYGDPDFYNKLKGVYRDIGFDEEYIDWLNGFVSSYGYEDYFDFGSFDDNWGGWESYENEYGGNISSGGSCEYGYDYENDEYDDGWIYDFEEEIWYMYEDDILYLYDDETDTIFYYDEQDDKIYYYDEEIDDWCEVEE